MTLQTDWVTRHLSEDDLGIVDLSVTELLQGTRTNRDFAKAEAFLSKIQVLDTCGLEFKVEAARNYRMLRSHGLTVRSTVDCLIATACLRESFQLLHNDRDFDGFEQYLGLKVLRPARM